MDHICLSMISYQIAILFVLPTLWHHNNMVSIFQILVKLASDNPLRTIAKVLWWQACLVDFFRVMIHTFVCYTIIEHPEAMSSALLYLKNES